MSSAVAGAGDWLPLTSAQLGLWFAHTLDPDNPCHTTAEVVELGGPIDPERLYAAHLAAYREFEQLRVTFAVTADGPRQRVGDPVVTLPVVPVANVAEAEAWLRADLARPFALTPGAPPPLRAALLTLPDGRCWWYHAAHHVLLDGYGAQQLLRRIAEAYADPSVRCAPTLAEVVAEDAAAPDPEADTFWEPRLAAMNDVVAIAGRTADPAPAALRRQLDVSPELQDRIIAGARRCGYGWTDLVTAAVGSYLARVAGRTSTRVGLPLMNRAVPGRGRLASASTVCTAMNVLPVTVPAAGSVTEALAAAAADQRAVREHPQLRQEELGRRLRRLGAGSAGAQLVGAQLFGAQLNLIPFDLEIALATPSTPGSLDAEAPRAETRGVVRNLTAGPVEDMTVCLRGTPGRGRTVRLELDANPRLYSADELDLHLDRLLTWLGTFADAPGAAMIETLPLTTDAERRRIDAFNDTASPRRPRTLAERFATQVARTPDALALLHGAQRRTYAELDQASRRVAAALRAQGVRPGEVVGVRLERSCALFESIQGIELIGAVYLPLDPDLPQARLLDMLEDAGCTVVIAEQPGPEPVTITPASCAQTPPATDLTPFDDPAAPAYLLFTSGSTGRPKGVLVGHAAIDNRLDWMQAHFALRPGERVLHKTPISFDVSVWELFWAHQVGACVVVADPGAHRDPRALASVIVEQEVAVLHFVPSMLRAFLADRSGTARVGSARVRAVVCSGEALTTDLVSGCTAAFGVAPTNLYGPTEAAVDVTVWECDPHDEGPVPIGRPLTNTTCHVLAPDGSVQPIGVPGELWLGGVQLADGYIGQPELTAERFREVPGIGGRLYRTGDLVAWRPDGALRYLGRLDDQVKIRGQRVELGEIEQVLAGVDGVVGVAVGVHEGRLVLWYAAADPADGHRGSGPPRTACEAALRERATRHLPAGWVPSAWVTVPQIPVGSTGKADRRRLLREHPPRIAVTEEHAPVSLLEQQVADLVAGLLGIEQAPRDADFFDLGGDSLSALRLLAGIDDDFGVSVTLADVFEHPTVAELATLVASGGSGRTGLEPVLTLRRGDPERAPLVLLPPAGGLGWCWTGLLRALPADLPVIALQAPGIGAGTPELPADLDALARRQLETIRSLVGLGAFRVAGWSLGGMAAQAVGALARAEGQQVDLVLALDAYPSDQWAHLGAPDEAEALRGVLRMGGVEPLLPDGVPVTRELVARLLREGGSAVAALPEAVLAGCIASVVGSAAVVRDSEHRPLPGDLHLVVATAPRPESWLRPQGWKEHVDGELVVHEIDVTHGELVRRPAVDRIGALITGLLAAAPQEPTHKSERDGWSG
ncbi:non-ribosomal peptide synthetase [Nocardioides daejeonensis]|uniref:non-ribosomal peptide synthetase n=1 Tax=Nocardioides daejeonensis TaxID=1046556 RepID=UPI000D740EA7|nr:non-ribosomal peptide synthetase [Nocardioides daejeonensis]